MKILLLLLLLLPASLMAQKRVSGTVTDGDGSPLTGVTVLVKGTTNGVATDYDGLYALDNITESNVLVFSFIGFKTQEITVGDQNTINVSLIEDATQLDDVVVVGYGTQKKVNVTGAVTAVTSDQLENRPAATVSSLLAGQAPGLTVIQSGGNPGRDSGSFNIRGIGTLNNANPLIIVDGIETGSITELNPEDIASVSILKDAASSAIYGVRAANGVILITTKRGSKNTKVKVKFSQQVGFSDFISLPNKVNSYDLAALHNEANTNDGAGVRFTDEDLKKFQDGSSPLTHANTDHVGKLFSNSGFWLQENLSISGGTEKGAYSVSLGYLDQEGIINNTGLERYTMRLNLDNQITNRLSLGLNLSGAFNKVTDPAAGIGWVTHTAFREWANDILQFPDGRWADPAWSGFQHNTAAYASDEMGLSIARDIRAITTGFAEYQIAKGLSAKALVSVLTDRNKTSTDIRGVELYKIDTQTGNISDIPTSSTVNLNNDSPLVDKISRSYYDHTDINIQLLLNYENTFGKHFVKGLLGYNQRSITSENAALSRRGILDASIDQINGADASQDDTSGNTTEFALRSGFARINYVFADRYLFEANVRYDGTSRFRKDLRFDYFPSISLGWRLSEESFFDFEKVNNLKLRASWGQLGNQEISDYQFLSTFSLGSNYIFNGQQIFGINESRIVNRNIQWEKATSKNIGIDLGLFDNRLSFTADYFIRDTDDILFTLPKPGILGGNPPSENAASVRNSGFEIEASYKESLGDFSYYLSANLSKVKNEITDLANADTPGRSVGDPIRNLYGYRSNGLFQSQAEIDDAPDQSSLGNAPQPGDIRYVDINNDGVVNPDDRENNGTPFPQINYGFSFGVAYKGIDLSTVWQGVADVDTRLNGRLNRSFWLGASPLEYQLDRWTPDNTNARFPRTSLNNTSNYVASDYWIENTSFLKLRNIQLGYALPQSILDKLGIQKLRFFISGENLLTISKFKRNYGFDPEDVTGGSDPLFFIGSNTTNNYPTTKKYILGLNLTF